MMAEVGGMVNVSGSRIATPLAPPRPGRTPMMTPSRMPTIIKAKLYQDSATLKPPMSDAISSTSSPSRSLPRACELGSITLSTVNRSFCLRAWYTMCQLRGSVQYGWSAPANRLWSHAHARSRVHNRQTCSGLRTVGDFSAPHTLAYGIPETTQIRRRAPARCERGRHPPEDRADRRGLEPQGARLRRAEDGHHQHEHLRRRRRAASRRARPVAALRRQPHAAARGAGPARPGRPRAGSSPAAASSSCARPRPRSST